jgi:hypothetical protein
MKALTLAAAGIVAMSAVWAQAHAERRGKVVVEAERFDAQEKDSVRKWHVVRAPEGFAAGASGGAYVEVRPDTRVTHDDKLIPGENFSDEAGRIAVLHYRVRFETAGRYSVWVSAYSTGTEDNGIHVGMNGTWPESGRRMQWCEGKNSWHWASAQRTAANHCGEHGKIYLDVAAPGVHTISFSMREDGFRFDRWMMITDAGFHPGQWAAVKSQ